MDNYSIVLSIKSDLKGKPLSPNGANLTYGWKSVTYTPAQVVKHISNGYQVCVAQFENGHRNKKHFQRSSLLALDYDQNLSDSDYQALIASDFFRRYAFAVIQTASSKPDSRRCRVLFQLDQVVENVADYSDLVRFVISVAPVGADPAAKDASRAFYGSRPGTVPDFYNPSNVLKIGAILEEIKRERERERGAREKRRDIELSGDLIRDIEKGLGVTAYNADHWSNAIPCIKQHQNDLTRPAAFWNEDSHILHCFKCGVSYLAKEVAGHLGIEWRSAPPPDRSRDFAAMPGEVDRPRYHLAALPSPLRKAMIKDGMTNLCRLIDALLWRNMPLDRVFTLADILGMMEGYGMSRPTVYRAMGLYSQKLKVALEQRNNALEFETSYSNEYKLESMLAALEACYSYRIIDSGNFLQDHEIALCSGREYRLYSLLESIPIVDQKMTGKEMAAAFGLSEGTISTYTNELKHRGYIEITKHFKRIELTFDSVSELPATISKIKETHSNLHLQMFKESNGRRVPYLHKGGKKGIPNNRIPPLSSAAGFFIQKSICKKWINGQLVEYCPLILIAVSKSCNSYRRLPAKTINNPVLKRLVA